MGRNWLCDCRFCTRHGRNLPFHSRTMKRRTNLNKNSHSYENNKLEAGGGSRAPIEGGRGAYIPLNRFNIIPSAECPSAQTESKGCAGGDSSPLKRMADQLMLRCNIVRILLWCV